MSKEYGERISWAFGLLGDWFSMTICKDPRVLVDHTPFTNEDIELVAKFICLNKDCILESWYFNEDEALDCYYDEDYLPRDLERVG